MDLLPCVYLVEDDAAARDSLELLINRTGLAVTVCASVGEFLPAYQPGRPCCLVYDIFMQHMSCAELLAELIHHKISLPVIFLINYEDVHMMTQATSLCPVDFMIKPVQPALLLSQIQTLIAAEKARH
ncbi:response regulator [Methylomonas paludis]|uniref:Response regulator n=1 Tax=Methylomonas paludis TaxID=1173101 RepID=A0A975MR76_9GAMM|nr:response regulator [Methylomonas paludis]QWF72041.1 response regulator [Methylomonas paludis]